MVMVHVIQNMVGVLYLELALIMSGEGEEIGRLERSREREEAAEGDAGGLEGAVGEEEGEGGEAGMEDSHEEPARDMFEKITES